MHGIRVLEAETNIGATRQVDSAIPCVIGQSDIRLGSLSRDKKLHSPVIAYSFDEAKEKLGYNENWGNTIYEAMFVLFKIFNVSPVVFINVSGASAADWETVTDETISVYGTEGRETIYTAKSMWADPESITITGLTAGKDFTAEVKMDAENFSTHVEIRDLTGKITETTKINYKTVVGAAAASYTGGYDAETGKTSGIDLVDTVYHECGVLPSVLLAPDAAGKANYETVTAALIAKAKQYDGVFSAVAAIDLDDGIKDYSDAADAAKKLASPYAVACWPGAPYGEWKYIHRSVLFAGMCASTDADYGGIPYASPSNRACPVTGGTVWTYGTTKIEATDINLTLAQANAVENAGVWTGLRLDAWKAWGTYTTAVSTSSDPKDIFISVRRMLNWHKNSFIVNYFAKIDNPANTRLIENLIDSENKRIDGLKAIGAVAGGKMEFRAEDNPVGNLLAGKLTFRQKLGFWVPAREIENTIEIDTELVAAALGGEA